MLAVEFMISTTSFAVKSGTFDIISPATPETKGAAILVPDSVINFDVDVLLNELILLPGAAISLYSL